MDIKELARQLDGCEYRQEMTEDLEREAKSNGLVVVFGASDDLVELRGAIEDEVDCYNPSTILLTKCGVMEDRDEECGHCKYYRELKKAGVPLKCEYGNGEYPWMFEFAEDIEAEYFSVLEDGEKYCRGIVFRLADLNAVE